MGEMAALAADSWAEITRVAQALLDAGCSTDLCWQGNTLQPLFTAGNPLLRLQASRTSRLT